MATQTDVKSIRISGTGTAGIASTGGTKVRVKGLWVSATAAGNTCKLTDNASGGPVMLSVDLGAAGQMSMTVPGEGILFNGDVYVTLAGAGAVATIFYG